MPGFGNEGVVDMKPGALNGLDNSSFGLSSPPIVYKNVVITGAHVRLSRSWRSLRNRENLERRGFEYHGKDQ